MQQKKRQRARSSMRKITTGPKKAVPTNTVVDEDPSMDGKPKQGADSAPPPIVFTKAKVKKNKVLFRKKSK